METLENSSSSGDHLERAESQKRRRHTFLHINSPTSCAQGSRIGRFLSSSHLNLPTFTISKESSNSLNDSSSWRFNFVGAFIRKYSTSTIHQSESMQSLCIEALKKFIQNSQVVELKNFLDKGNSGQINDRDDTGSTALIIASQLGRTTIVKELLRYGADSDCQDNDGWTSLMFAAKEGYVEIAQELLDRGCNLELRDIGCWTALIWACYKGHLQVAELLLDKGAEVNVHDNLHATPLIWASGRGFTRIVEVLINHNAKVNLGDKYGTTALTWACRKGYIEIAELLLKNGASADMTGMYNWTPLILATTGNYVNLVRLLLQTKPNVNAVDKDGCTALTIACKEGFTEIASYLTSANAYLNIHDRSGETHLTYAVKGGHKTTVELLLKKYVDVNILGKERKSPIYVAVEKQNIPIIKLLLNANPDLELATKTGDTPLLKAVRDRNIEIVQLLLEKKAKVSAVDNNGDTVLHVAMRARSKSIVELLLRNPKNSQLLYRPNKQGDTPYNIDLNNPKPILAQIFGARRLNTNEDNENMLGYDLYNSALADILSEPSLSMPITVGLYARWGSGKSFLLGKLREEMNNFARNWQQPVFEFSFVLFLIVAHVSISVACIVGAVLGNQLMTLAIASFSFFFVYLLLTILWCFSQKLDYAVPSDIVSWLAKKLNYFHLVFQVMFCHPPSYDHFESVQPISFFFTDQTRVSSSVSGENTLAHIVGSLYDTIESHYGRMPTRLYRAFRPKPVRQTFTHRWRKSCCIPYFLVFELCIIAILIAIVFCILFVLHNNRFFMINMTISIVSISVSVIIVAVLLTNIRALCKMFSSIVFSHRKHLQRSIAQLDSLKSEGFVNIVKAEVDLMTDMIKCLDSLSCRQSRLVIVIDGLDSCEQEKVLLMLDAVHMMFAEPNKPFIIILAIDPHIISKAVEVGSCRLFNENTISGYNYLHNLVHLPFYLQNSGLRKHKIAKQTANSQRRADLENNSLGRSQSTNRISTDNCTMIGSNEKLKVPGLKKSSTKLKISESIASSIGSNLNRISGANDLTRYLVTDDYFSDVNPKSMRRLLNVVYVTGRLLKAFHIDFNWYRLARWINITEQWPYRTTWIIFHFDMNEANLDENMSLKSIYDLVKPLIAANKGSGEPLHQLDRNESKLDVFLSYHRSSLLLSDLKIFLPFTINLDPYIKKVIKNQYQETSETNAVLTMAAGNKGSATATVAAISCDNDHRSTGKQKVIVKPVRPVLPTTNFTNEAMAVKLSELDTEGICGLLKKCDGLSAEKIDQYAGVIKLHNINGRVLLHCDLNELKSVLSMSFGDWELFRMMIVSLREFETTKVFCVNEHDVVKKRSVFASGTASDLKVNNRNSTHIGSCGKEKAHASNGVVIGTSAAVAAAAVPASNRSSLSETEIIEKQVTLEEQVICGALKTLNEEAFEDVIEESLATNIPLTNIILPSPESEPVSYVSLPAAAALALAENSTSDATSSDKPIQLQTLKK